MVKSVLNIKLSIQTAVNNSVGYFTWRVTAKKSEHSHIHVSIFIATQKNGTSPNYAPKTPLICPVDKGWKETPKVTDAINETKVRYLD